VQHDRIFVVDELYERGLGPEDLARAVLRQDEQFGRELDGVIDSAAFAEISLGNESGKGSRGHIMNSAPFYLGWQPSQKGAGSRVQGVSAIHQRLALKNDGYGGLMICRNARNLVRTLPAMGLFPHESRGHRRQLRATCNGLSEIRPHSPQDAVPVNESGGAVTDGRNEAQRHIS